MNKNLAKIAAEIYSACALEITCFEVDPESRDYDACSFKLNDLRIISRSAKITPKKVGQFVTFWKRNIGGPIEPFEETDPIDFYVITVRNGIKLGQFVFPKSILIGKGIISSAKKDGKRGFRVYPRWDVAINTQAKNTQKWQLAYFYEINKSTDVKTVVNLFSAK